MNPVLILLQDSRATAADFTKKVGKPYGECHPQKERSASPRDGGMLAGSLDHFCKELASHYTLEFSEAEHLIWGFPGLVLEQKGTKSRAPGWYYFMSVLTDESHGAICSWRFVFWLRGPQASCANLGRDPAGSMNPMYQYLCCF